MTFHHILLEMPAASCGMPELLVCCEGMSELLAPREVKSVNGKVRFLTDGESLPLHFFNVTGSADALRYS
jgi:hypothetical protein